VVLGGTRPERGPAAELSAAILANGGRLQQRLSQPYLATRAL
jgi:hypothetical protein